MYSYKDSPDNVGTYSAVLNLFLASIVMAGFREPNILDVGAGTGLYAEALLNAGCNVTALDPSPDSMRNTSATKIYSTLENASLPDNSFDAIHIKDSLEHVRDKDEFFEKCHVVIRPGGIVMCVFDENPTIISIASILSVGRTI